MPHFANPGQENTDVKTGPVSKAEYERLVYRIGRNRCGNRPFSGLKDGMPIAERVALARQMQDNRCMAAGTVSGHSPLIVTMATERARAQLAAARHMVTAMSLLLIAPEEMTEPELRDYTREAFAAAELNDTEIIRERTDRVTAHVTASGRKLPGTTTDGRELPDTTAGTTTDGRELPGTADAPDTEDRFFLVMSGTAGIEGTLLLYEAEREMLEARYPRHFLNGIPCLKEELATAGVIYDALKSEAVFAVPCAEAGVYGALWDLGEMLRVGMRVSLPEIPIARTTIEVCEVSDIDPYMMPSGGSIIFVTQKPDLLCETLNRTGWETAVIGELTKEAARILDNRGETRFLEPFRGSSLTS